MPEGVNAEQVRATFENGVLEITSLKRLKVAILVDDGFEQVEPRKALDQAGAETRIVSLQREHVRGWDFTDWGEEFAVDMALDRARPDDFDALFAGRCRQSRRAAHTTEGDRVHQGLLQCGKPVASICHGPWTVIEAGAARGRRSASWPSLRTDLQNAGAEWVDKEVVVDGNNREMIDLFSRSRQSLSAA